MSDRAKYWARLVESWRKSGLTQVEFCRRRGVKAVTFAWWKRKLRVAVEGTHQRSGRSTGSRRCRGAKFAEITWPGQALPGGISRTATSDARSGGYEIVLSDGLLIRLPGDFDPERASELIGLVASRC